LRKSCATKKALNFPKLCTLNKSSAAAYVYYTELKLIDKLMNVLQGCKKKKGKREKRKLKKQRSVDRNKH
jgi:hypothetical protein